MEKQGAMEMWFVWGPDVALGVKELFWVKRF